HATGEQLERAVERHEIGELAERLEAAIGPQHGRATERAHADERVVVAKLDLATAVRARGLHGAPRTSSRTSSVRAPRISVNRSRQPVARRGVQQYAFSVAVPASGNVWIVRCDSASKYIAVMPPGSGNTWTAVDTTCRDMS